ncbi:hypothetical protein BaRGS_00012916 [Batillaria attramentaria]|uniref:Uncharacterized protein n=1 Tax=Batillaria attramentaria TaxID=370345 RepID=A0ABD0L8P8_9CAEN
MSAMREREAVSSRLVAEPVDISERFFICVIDASDEEFLFLLPFQWVGMALAFQVLPAKPCCSAHEVHHLEGSIGFMLPKSEFV